LQHGEFSYDHHDDGKHSLHRSHSDDGSSSEKAPQATSNVTAAPAESGPARVV
jgi:hypothetical protein